MPRHGPGTSARGDGHQHQKRRERIARVVAAGGVRCWRCGRPIHPREPWDLGHDDRDRSRYRGPEHAACDRATKAHAKARRALGVSAKASAKALSWFDTDR